MSDIHEQINILIDVQDVETQILQAKRKIDALNTEADALDKDLTLRETAAATDRQAVDELKKSYRDFELLAQETVDLITKSNEKLRGVKTNKEYQSILKEIEETRKRKSEIEDRMLEILEQIETQEAAVKDQEAKLLGFVEFCKENKAAIAEKSEDEKKTVDSLVAKKGEIESKADPQNIALLAEVREKVRGQPLVPVQGSICMGCHMNIPAQLFNELQRFDQLRFCPHCHRIIYWKDS